MDDFVKSKRPPKSKPDMIDLLRELYRAMYRHTETFEKDNIGADLAYLMGAIVSDNSCVWEPDRPLVNILRAHFPEGHKIWEYVATSDE